MNITTFYGKKYCGRKLPGDSTYKSLRPIDNSSNCDSFITKEQPKWTECTTVNYSKTCAPGDKCPINRIWSEDRSSNSSYPNV
jgi:hypothetical protein